MPGPKMGPRPDDFNEDLVRKAPTFDKWLRLEPGEELTYACRKFVKGGVDDEERLMRRIMIARRNNLKDHATIKKARATEASRRGVVPGTYTKTEKKAKRKARSSSEEEEVQPPEPELMPLVMGADDSHMQLPSLLPPRPPSPSNPSGTKRRRRAGVLQPTDEELLLEMDVPAVEATRSYRRWLALPDGAFFTYNQTYTKGDERHDWLLKKNIWRRMRYRRENRVKVERMDGQPFRLGDDWGSWKPDLLGDDSAGAHAPAPLDADLGARGDEEALVSRAVVDAAAAAAAQVDAFEPGIDADAVAALGAEDPIVSCALDAAAQLAASAVADLPQGLAPTNAELEEAVLGDDGVEAIDVTIRA